MHTPPTCMTAASAGSSRPRGAPRTPMSPPRVPPVGVGAEVPGVQGGVQRLSLSPAPSLLPPWERVPSVTRGREARVPVPEVNLGGPSCSGSRSDDSVPRGAQRSCSSFCFNGIVDAEAAAQRVERPRLLCLGFSPGSVFRRRSPRHPRQYIRPFAGADLRVCWCNVITPGGFHAQSRRMQSGSAGTGIPVWPL